LSRKAFQEDKTDKARIAGITAALKEEPEQILAECDAHMAYAGNNYYPFLLPLCKIQRPLLFNCLELINVKSTTNDQSLIRAIHLILEHRNSHKEMLSLVGDGSSRRNQINIHWIPEKWRKLVTGKKVHDSSIHEVHRKYFELCVFTHVMRELKSGDLFVAESEHYNDYRDQLIDWETFEAQISEYGEMVELPTQPKAFVDNLKQQLIDTAHKIDSQYPGNEHLEMTSDGIVIRKHTKDNKPEALSFVDQQVSEKLPTTNIMEATAALVITMCRIGLAYLLGINLMPRIRGLKKLIFFKPDKTIRYEHINKLFGESINCRLIETHLPDMLRIVLSIKAGKITPSTILRRLGTYSCKNKLYFAFRELGRAVRTIFLLNYIGDVELRKTIQAATNKSDEFNNFTKWLFFDGEGIIAENIQHEQRKVIRYNQLVANLVILHNVDAMTRVVKILQKEGHPVDAEILAGLSSYRTEHVNRLGDYRDSVIVHDFPIVPALVSLQH